MALSADTVDGLNSRGNGQAARTASRSDSRKSRPMPDREHMRKHDHRDDHRSDASWVRWAMTHMLLLVAAYSANEAGSRWDLPVSDAARYR